jgi:hypothetical protein
LPIPLTTTTIAADTTSLRDTALARGTHGSGNYNGRHIEIIEAVTVPGTGPALGEVAAVDDAGFDLTDKLTTSPAFSQIVQTGTDYLMYPRKLVPETLVDAINDVLTKIEAPYLWAPSLVADSDMGSGSHGRRTNLHVQHSRVRELAGLSSRLCDYGGYESRAIRRVEQCRHQDRHRNQR